MDQNFNHFRQISTNLYKRKNQDKQHVLMAVILLTAGIAFFLIKGPQPNAFTFAGIMFLFAIASFCKTGSSVVIDLNNKAIIQKSGLLTSKRTISFGDIQDFSISNKIYVLLLISSVYAFIDRSGKQKSILLGQSLMNSKINEELLLETEKILGRR